jgi:hypothetical protein
MRGTRREKKKKKKKKNHIESQWSPTYSKGC